MMITNSRFQQVGTQFVRREWCTCLRQSRADGEDSGFLFGIVGRGRVSVDQTTVGSTFLLISISTVSRFARCIADCRRVSASHHHAGWTACIPFFSLYSKGIIRYLNTSCELANSSKRFDVDDACSPQCLHACLALAWIFRNLPKLHTCFAFYEDSDLFLYFSSKQLR
jgi:hypothetical protein